MTPSTISEAALFVIGTEKAQTKAEVSRAMATRWAAGELDFAFNSAPPDRPGRPDRPVLRPPREMAKRRAGWSRANRVALLHAVAHIELNAIDLAWDMVARFGGDMPREFTDDWVRVGDDEARHFLMLQDRLASLGATFGDLPAHDGLWEAAQETAHDLAARLAVVPLVLEARGLDVTPAMIDRFDRMGDAESARALRVIYQDEITHVAAGRHWLEHLCARDNADPVKTYQNLVTRYFRGQIKPPFNEKARNSAGFGAEFYLPLTPDAS